MDDARINAKGRTTIPKRVRDAARLHGGALVSLVVEGGGVTLRKLEEGDAYLSFVQASLSEWNSFDDEKAWVDL